MADHVIFNENSFKISEVIKVSVCLSGIETIFKIFFVFGENCVGVSARKVL